METLTGVLLDVSGSMKQNVGGGVDVEDHEDGQWVCSIFNVINNFVKYDVSLDDQIFAVGVGETYGIGFFDILKTIEQFQTTNTTPRMQLPQTYEGIVDEFYHLLEMEGARSIKLWVTKDTIMSAVSLDMAASLLMALKSNDQFLKYFVYKCLPQVCRDDVKNEDDAMQNPDPFRSFVVMVASSIKQANVDDIKKIVQQAIGEIVKNVGSVYSIQRATEILRGCIDEDKLKKDRIKELMKIVQPFIYGGTPLYQALQETTKIFSELKYSKHQKLLFVLSDGEPTDQCLPSVFQNLISREVIVVSCLITSKTNIQPRKLYSVEKGEWNKGAKFLFKLSSTLPSQLLPRTIFIKRGWDIDISNNETKLFLQVNHPDNINDVCDLAKNLVCCQDSLSELLVTVSLDIYINQSNSDAKARDQGDEKTCYAYAAAAVFHLAMKRILGRTGGYPNFDALKKEMVEEHGIDGADTLKVIKSKIQKYRLNCNTVNTIDAMKAIVAKRPVVARFYLTDPEWAKFRTFFKKKPTGILTSSDIGERAGTDSLQGHAVVFTSYDSKCLRFMNSWGDSFADNGFFRVQNAQVLGLEFIDVFWTEKDLFPQEIEYFKNHGSEVADNIIKRFKGLQNAVYECPNCLKKSLVTKYTGTLNAAVCPECKTTFSSNTDGNILALNMYLTSLAQ